MATATMGNLLAVVALLISAATAASSPPATVYTNHTVGGTAGWFFNVTSNTSATDYSAWAATQTFNLGDFLIFNTDSNSSVIQTYSNTTYLSCTIDDAQSNDTFQYDGGETKFGEPLTVAVPLTKEGPNYYFSDGDDGGQCQRGMAFTIQVQHGLGLPPSLNQPPPPPYTEPPGPDSAQSPPITIPQTPPSGAFSLGTSVSTVFLALLYLLTFLVVSNALHF